MIYKTSRWGDNKDVFSQMENSLKKSIKNLSTMADILDDCREIFVDFVNKNEGKQVTRGLSTELLKATNWNMGWFAPEGCSSTNITGEYLTFTEREEMKRTGVSKPNGVKYIDGGIYGMGTVILETPSRLKSDRSRLYYIDKDLIIKRYDEARERCRKTLDDNVYRIVELEKYAKAHEEWERIRTHHRYMYEHYTRVMERLSDSFNGKDYNNLNYGLGRK